ncbi:MAG: hypothetical protein GY775_06920 [Candidatus Scalindua sp.]|nr:hypothetical protein [Candidatus Scalindua sp.]
MENNNFRLSVNAKIIILILLFLNVGYAYKKIKQYNHIKESGYSRERTVQEQFRRRIMKSFGSVEEVDRLVDDMANQKEYIGKLKTALKVQEKQLSKVYKELENANTIIKEERDYLHNKIRGMADGFSKRKDQYGQMSKIKEVLKDAKSKYESENARLQKKIYDLEVLLSESKNQ